MRDLCDGVEESGNTREVPTWAHFLCWGRVRGVEDAKQDDEQPKHTVLAVRQEGLGKGAGGGGLDMRPNMKNAPWGHVQVFDRRGGLSKMMNIQHMPLRACLGCLSRGAGERSRTQRTRPQGCVFHVQQEGWIEENVEHVEHAPKGVLDMLDVRGGMTSMSDTSNTPRRVCST